MFSKTSSYQAVPAEEALESGQQVQASNLYASRVKRWLSEWIPWTLALVLLGSHVYNWVAHNDREISNAVFSPAMPAVRYHNIVMSAGTKGEHSPYMGDRTEEKDGLWEDLFEFGTTKIPLSDAAQLTNRTMPIAKDPGYYAVTLDVFHQLHCLNTIRKRLWSRLSFEEMEKMPHLMSSHVDHCVDSIRQTLMCSGDVTPIPYQWYKQFDSGGPAFGIMKTCRDFDALRDWAKARETEDFYMEEFVEDPLGNAYHE